MTAKQYEEFIKFKEFVEKQIIDSSQIVVSTCMSALTERLRKKRFAKVIVDEAA